MPLVSYLYGIEELVTPPPEIKLGAPGYLPVWNRGRLKRIL